MQDLLSAVFPARRLRWGRAFATLEPRRIERTTNPALGPYDCGDLATHECPRCCSAPRCPTVVGLVGLVLLCGLPGREPAVWMRLLGTALLLLSLLTIAALAWHARQPRVGYRDRQLFVWLRSARRFACRSEAVECFWLGQSPTLLPGRKAAPPKLLPS